MIEFEQVKNFYRISKELKLEHIRSLVSSAKRRTFARGEFLIHEGSRRNEVFLVNKGLVRCFKVNPKGMDITMNLISEGTFIFNRDLILLKEPSQVNFMAIETTRTWRMDFNQFYSFINENPALQESKTHILQYYIATATKRIHSFVLLSPEERYEQFLKEYPKLVQRAPDKYIAQMLGITPVSLSRIKGRIACRS